MKRRDAGFSLLEVLVTLFIVGMLSSAGVAIMSMTLDGRALVDEGDARVAGVERLHAALKSDLLQLVERASRDQSGARRPFVFYGGANGAEAPLLAFVRTGRENPGGLEARGSTAYVEYALEDGALVRRMTARTDPARDTPVVEARLLEGVARADVSFAVGGGWVSSYIVAPSSMAVMDPPAAVELLVELEGGDQIRQLFLTGLGS